MIFCAFQTNVERRYCFKPEWAPWNSNRAICIARIMALWTFLYNFKNIFPTHVSSVYYWCHQYNYKLLNDNEDGEENYVTLAVTDFALHSQTKTRIYLMNSCRSRQGMYISCVKTDRKWMLLFKYVWAI